MQILRDKMVSLINSGEEEDLMDYKEEDIAFELDLMDPNVVVDDTI